MMKSSALFERGPSPHTSTSRPPDVIHVIGVPRPSPLFCAASVYYTERKPKNKKRGMPGNEATKMIQKLFASEMVVL